MNKIITISREFGNGSREVGKRLADKLGFSYYDREIVAEILALIVSIALLIKNKKKYQYA